MYIKFQTLKANEELITGKLSKYVRQGNYTTLEPRPHKKNPNMVVFEMQNRFEKIIDDFEDMLRGMERRNEVAQLKIEQIKQ